MAKYRFEQFDIDMVNPIIEIDPVVNRVDPINMTISANLIMRVDAGDKSVKFALTLNDIPVVNLTYTNESLEARVMEKLQEFIVE